MRVEWHGQSAFAFEGGGKKVFIDPFGDMSAAAAHGIEFNYPPISADGVDLLLVTHEHMDHNGVEAVAGEPLTLRSTAGTHESPLGDVVGVASEHDEAAGTERGPNTIFVFDVDGVRVAHFGDFGQAELRAEQRKALGEPGSIDLLIVPVGDGPTIGAAGAKALVDALQPRWVVPMHYRTHRISFLETEEDFAGLMPEVQRLRETSFETAELPAADGPLLVVPAAP